MFLLVLPWQLLITAWSVVCLGLSTGVQYQKYYLSEASYQLGQWPLRIQDLLFRAPFWSKSADPLDAFGRAIIEVIGSHVLTTVLRSRSGNK